MKPDQLLEVIMVERLVISMGMETEIVVETWVLVQKMIPM